MVLGKGGEGGGGRRSPSSPPFSSALPPFLSPYLGAPPLHPSSLLSLHHPYPITPTLTSFPVYTVCYTYYAH